MKKPEPLNNEERLNAEMKFMLNFSMYEEKLKEQYKEDMSEGLHNLDFYSWLILFAHAYYFYQEEE